MRFALAALTLTAACGTPAQDEGPPPPEVTLHQVRLRSYRGSALTAVGRSETMSYERASADVISGPGTLDVLSRESPSVTGRLPPATRIETHAGRGNLLSRGIDVWGGVRLRTPGGLEGMTERAHLDSLTMHESTVSRVTTAKYVHTPQGIFELKYFFNSSIARVAGDDIASEAVKNHIKLIVAAEDAKTPYSDQKIVELLRAQGIDIARRTVAKYREVLGVLPSSKRKRYY